MKYNAGLTATLTAALALFSVSLAQAVTPPVLTLSDGTDSATIDITGTVACTGICSTSPGFPIASPGLVEWAGIVGPFSVHLSAGESKPFLSPPQIQLSLQITTGNTGGTLTARWSDTGFDGVGPVSMQAASTLHGSVLATYTGYVDNSNALFGTGTMVGSFVQSGTGGANTITGPGASGQPYSMTGQVVAVMGPSSLFSLAGLNLMGTPPPPLTLNCVAATTGQVGVPYNSALVASGGVPPYTYSITGSLPPGLTLDTSTGIISGTPQQPAGTFSFTAQVVDSNVDTTLNTTQTGCQIVTSPPPPLSLICPATTTGLVGLPYASALVAAGGIPPYTFSLVSGNLPPNLNLDSVLGNITGIAAQAGAFSFTAQVTDNWGDSASTPISGCPITVGQITVNKTPDGGAFTMGGQASFQIVVSNSTFTTVKGVQLTDVLPTNGGMTWTSYATTQGSCDITGNTLNCNLGDFAPGASASINVYSPPTTPEDACQLQPNPAAQVLVNGVVVAQDSGSLTCTPPAAQLTVVKTPKGGNFTMGAQASFTIAVSNPASAGSQSASNVQLTDTLPTNGGLTWATATPSQGTCNISGGSALSCSLGTIAPGASVTVVVVSPATTPDAACTSQPNPAAIATATGGLTAQDSGSLTCTPPAAQLTVVKTPKGGNFTMGAQVSFTIAVSNPASAGSQSASNVQLTDTLPTNGGLTWATATPSQGTCNISGGNALSCSLGTIAPGASVTVVVMSPATTPNAACTSQPNPVALATATGGLTAQDSGSLTCTPPAAQLTVVKTPKGGNFTMGAQVSFTIAVSNPASAGSQSASNVQLTDTLPTNGGLTWATATSSQGTCNISGGNALSCSLGTIAPGASVTVVVVSPATTPNAACTSQPNPVALATATGGLTAQDSGSLTCTMPPPSKPNLDCATCSSILGFVGKDYSASENVTGGVAPYTFQVVSGNLPPGLTFDSSTGTLSGTPTQTGLFVFTTKVTDSAGNTDTATCLIIILKSPVQLNCGACGSNPGAGQVGVTYTDQLTVNGGKSPYTFSLVSGSLPPGLTLNQATGAITGKPTTAGSYTFTIKVVDANGFSDTATCTIVVKSPIDLNCGACGSTAGSGQTGSSYTDQLTVTGGVSPYTFSIVSGSLPPGLTLNTSTGKISGTPTTPGTYTFTAKVVDNHGNSDTATCTINIKGSLIDLECGACGTGGKATVGTQYTDALTVKNGYGPYTFSIVSGSLPPGMTLNTSTGNISGKPTAAGTYTFTAKVVDSKHNSDTVDCTITVVTAPLDVTCGTCSGSAGTAWIGTPYTDALIATGGTPGYTFSIISGSLPSGLSLNSSTGNISGTPTKTGTFGFTVKVVDSKGKSDTTTCAITVKASPIDLNCGACGGVNGNAKVGNYYVDQLTVSHGTAPYTFSIISGKLAPGLSLNQSTGKISGSPTTSGTYTFTAQVVDGRGYVDTVSCTIVVSKSW